MPDWVPWMLQWVPWLKMCLFWVCEFENLSLSDIKKKFAFLELEQSIAPQVNINTANIRTNKSAIAKNANTISSYSGKIRGCEKATRANTQGLSSLQTEMKETKDEMTQFKQDLVQMSELFWCQSSILVFFTVFCFYL